MTGSTAGKVLVVGALGVVGRAALEHFGQRPGLARVGLSRHAPDFAPEASWVSADLRDAQATRAALAAHGDATHVVYAALNEQPDLLKGWRDSGNVDLNTGMLRNTLDALREAPLRHVTLLQGTKAYGVHTGRPMPVPARETDAVRDHANFYFDQQDLLAERAAAQGFGWTIFRPQIVLGVALGSAMNPVATLGAYAALSREAGQPLRYPGHPHLLTECTDARLIARAIAWAWDEPRAGRRSISPTATWCCGSRCSSAWLRCSVCRWASRSTRACARPCRNWPSAGAPSPSASAWPCPNCAT